MAKRSSPDNSGSFSGRFLCPVFCFCILFMFVFFGFFCLFFFFGFFFPMVVLLAWVLHS